MVYNKYHKDIKKKGKARGRTWRTKKGEEFEGKIKRRENGNRERRTRG